MAAASTISSTPSEILAKLGLTSAQASMVEQEQARLVILTTSAHMDWDWLLPFPLLVGGDPSAGAWSGVRQYFEGAEKAPAQELLESATEMLGNEASARYSVCEMSFLRGFAQAAPAAFARFVAYAERIHLAGAGITSPDNLLPHGEALIRNYLVGRAWATSAFPQKPPTVTISQSYLPDDFGHDPELPVTLAAMGMQGTAFARLPGTWIDDHDMSVAANAPLQAMELWEHEQIDFHWIASDGSSALAHWMARWYGRARAENVSSPGALASFLNHAVGPQEEDGKGKTILQLSPSQYVYVPCAEDFQTPLLGLAKTCSEWNKQPPITSPQPVYCAAGTFDDFIQLLASVQRLPVLGGTGPQFSSTPYFCGAQVSRPLLKISHHRTVRTLLAAEAMAALADAYGAPVGSLPATVASRDPSELLLEAWSLLVPSTHHDYITGTAHPQVYRSEQLPLLEAAASCADWLLEDAMASVAAVLDVPAPDESLAVFNALGIPRIVLAECNANAINAPATEQLKCGEVTGPVQISAEGSALFLADLPPLGCTAASPANGQQTSSSLDRVKLIAEPETSPTTIKLINAQLEVELKASLGWDVASCVDLSSKNELFPGGRGNTIAFFQDTGTEYLLGCEEGSSREKFADTEAEQETLAVEVLESGPLRARVRITTKAKVTIDGAAPVSVTFAREYALVAGESMLRMQLTGQAPESSTVFVKLPLGGSIATLVRGTPTHWTSQMPQLVWEGFTPYASHHFAIALGADGAPLGAILHGDIPPWGLMWSYSQTHREWSNDGTLYGALLRNTNGRYYGSTFPGGTDPDVHTRAYALLIPSACGEAATGEPLRQGLSYATPPTVAPLTGFLTPEHAVESLSLASTSGAAIVTAAKLGTRMPDALVLRVYLPGNEPAPAVSVTFDPHAVPGWSPGAELHASVISALEEELHDAAEATVSRSGEEWKVTFEMPRALATVALRTAS
jgi:alpha-mannosidase